MFALVPKFYLAACYESIAGERLFSQNFLCCPQMFLHSMIYSLFIFVLGRFLFAKTSSALSSCNVLPQWHFHQSLPPSHAHLTKLKAVTLQDINDAFYFKPGIANL